MAHFGGIVPCGIAPSDGTVTSLSAELARPISLAEANAIVDAEFRRLLPDFMAKTLL
jgi:lipoyl(octanoyl) transferase